MMMGDLSVVPAGHTSIIILWLLVSAVVIAIESCGNPISLGEWTSYVLQNFLSVRTRCSSVCGTVLPVRLSSICGSLLVRSCPLVLMSNGILNEAVGTYYYNPSATGSTFSSEYTATIAGIVLGGLVGLVLLIVIVIVIVHICCKGKHHRDRRRLVAPRDGPFTLGLGSEGNHGFTSQPVPPPAYDSLYPCPTQGDQTSREQPASPPPPYTERLTMHV